MSDFYNGNQNVKKVGIEQRFTPEQVKEYYKCKHDIIYFIKKYCKIITLDHGLQLLDLYPYQEEMIKAYSDKRFVINILPRQMGKTTAVAAFVMHFVLFNSEKSIGILANKASTAREILNRIKRMYENLPLWMQPGVKTWNKGDIELGNDSVIIAESTSSDSVRGFSFNMIFLDEFAHVEHQVEFWESTYPVISSGDSSKVIITSTPNGMDLFHKIYTEAEQGLNDFYPIKVHWSDHPKRDEKWKETTLKNIGQLQFDQEFEIQFLGSSGTLISGNALKQLTHRIPIVEGGGLSKYYDPMEAHNYIIIADVSRGKGLDYSAFQVIDVTYMPYQQVCVYRNNMVTPLDYADTIFRTAKAYNNASVLVEINDVGAQVADSLYYDFEFENIIFTENAGARGKRISTGYGKATDRGIRTTKTVKAIGCSMLKLLIEQHQLIINDHNTIDELSRFTKKGTSYEADKGCHDDLVMGLVLFAWMTDQQYFKEMTDISTLSKLRDLSDDELEQQLTPFGFIETGHDNYNDDVDLTATPWHPEFRFF
jgi:hypothetical protein